MLSRLVPYLALLLIPLACLEAFAFLSIWLLDDLYDHRDEVLPRLNEAGLAAFRDQNWHLPRMAVRRCGSLQPKAPCTRWT